MLRCCNLVKTRLGSLLIICLPQIQQKLLEPNHATLNHKIVLKFYILTQSKKGVYKPHPLLPATCLNSKEKQFQK